MNFKYFALFSVFFLCFQASDVPLDEASIADAATDTVHDMSALAIALESDPRIAAEPVQIFTKVNQLSNIFGKTGVYAYFFQCMRNNQANFMRGFHDPYYLRLETQKSLESDLRIKFANRVVNVGAKKYAVHLGGINTHRLFRTRSLVNRLATAVDNQLQANEYALRSQLYSVMMDKPGSLPLFNYQVLMNINAPAYVLIYEIV